MQPRDSVFISYCHRNKKWLERLLIMLDPHISTGLKVWADPYILVGEQWKRRIDVALEQARIGVLLVTPEFLASSFIKQEELPALLALAQAGEVELFCVPISASSYQATALATYQWSWDPVQPLDGLKAPARNQALVKIAGRLAERSRSIAVAPVPTAAAVLVARTTEAPPLATASEAGQGRLFGVPSHRPHFLTHADAQQALVERLVERRFGGAGGDGSAKVGLCGPGGIGKTELAIAVAHDARLRAAFPDGVHWIALGPRPDLLEILCMLVQDLGGKREGIATVARGKEALEKCLAGSRCLLVLDDIWALEHAVAFDVESAGSAQLVITRDGRLLTALNASEQRLDAWGEAPSLRLLASWAGTPANALPALALRVVAHCGGVPLALALAGACVRDGRSWSQVVTALDEGELEFLDHPHGSIFKSLRLSVDALASDDAERYLELGIFPDGAAVPEATVARLWAAGERCKPYQAHALLSTLARMGLLDVSGQEPARVVSRHGLQRAFQRLLLRDPAAVHGRLLDATARGLPARDGAGTPWEHVADADGYVFRHLAYHLIEADREDELRQLVTAPRYVGTKLISLGCAAMEADLKACRAIFPQDNSLEALRRSLAQQAHLLRGLGERDLVATLATRLPQDLRREWRAEMPAAVQADVLWPMPDLPHDTLQRTLEGHDDFVNCCAVDAVGAWIVSGSDDCTLRIWDSATGELLRTLVGGDGAIHSCALDPGRRWLVAAVGRELRLWDLQSGEPAGALVGHAAAVTCCAIDARRSRVVAGSKDNTLCVWGLEDRKLLHALAGHGGAVTSCAVGTHWIVSGSQDRTVRVWDAEGGHLLHVLEGHEGAVNCCALDAQDRWVVSGASDRTVRIWDARRQSLARVLTGHLGSVECCALDGERGVVVSGSSDRSLRVWSLDAGELLARLTGHSDSVNCCALDAAGRIVSGSWDQTLRIWQLNPLGGDVGPGPLDWVTCCAIEPCGDRVVTGSRDCSVRVWDRAGGLLRMLAGSATPVNCCAIDAPGHRVVAGSDDRDLRVWSADSGELVHLLAGHTDAVNCCSIEPHARWLVSGSLDGTLRVWDLASGHLLRELRGHRDSVNCCAIDASSQWIASGSDDGELRLWNARDGAVLAAVNLAPSPINCCAIAASGAWIAAGCDDQTIRLWDPNRRTMRELAGHEDSINCCAIDPLDTRILSGSDDQSLRVWDTSSARCC